MNHAVKEALDSCKLKAMCRSMDGNAEGTQILRRHAQEMQTDSQRLIQALASSSDIPGTRGQGTGTGTGTGYRRRGCGSGRFRRGKKRPQTLECRNPSCAGPPRYRPHGA